jgi:hypothetical protein
MAAFNPAARPFESRQTESDDHFSLRHDMDAFNPVDQRFESQQPCYYGYYNNSHYQGQQKMAATDPAAQSFDQYTRNSQYLPYFDPSAS